MKLSREERAALKESFGNMRPAEKIDYLFTYYRLPIFLSLLALILLPQMPQNIVWALVITCCVFMLISLFSYANLYRKGESMQSIDERNAA